MVWLNCTAVVKKKLGDDRLAQINVCKLQNLFLFCPITISKTIHKTYFLKLFHFGKITKATFITMCFCISLVFMPAWSRDNRNYQIITLDRTDDIHLLTFVNLCLHQEKFKGFSLQLLSEPRFRAILVT